MPTLDSQAWAAWVSAGAAVIQAIAAAAAIWYSGKLARDSAKRERLADENAARRIAEADAAAAEQRRLDGLANEAAAIERYNRPLDLAIALAESAYDEIRMTRDEVAELAVSSPTTLYTMENGVQQKIAMDRLIQIEGRIDNADCIGAIRRMQLSVRRFSEASVSAKDWLPSLDDRLEEIQEAIMGVFYWRKPTAATTAVE